MNTPVVDFHCHVGDFGKIRIDDEPDRFLRIMDAAGVDISCVFCIWYGDARRGNDITAEYVARNPDRFVGAGYVNPLYPDEAVAEGERAMDELGLRFIKLYPRFVERPIDAPEFEEVLQWADRRSLIVMSHHDRWPEPRRYATVAKRYPNVRWVVAHAGNGVMAAAEAVEAARTSRNIYLEASTSYADSEGVRLLVEGAGADRVLFGSDMPEQDVRYHVGRVMTAEISDQAKTRVLGLNALELLGLDAPTAR